MDKSKTKHYFALLSFALIASTLTVFTGIQAKDMSLTQTSEKKKFYLKNPVFIKKPIFYIAKCGVGGAFGAGAFASFCEVLKTIDHKTISKQEYTEWLKRSQKLAKKGIGLKLLDGLTLKQKCLRLVGMGAATVICTYLFHKFMVPVMKDAKQTLSNLGECADYLWEQTKYRFNKVKKALTE